MLTLFIAICMTFLILGLMYEGLKKFFPIAAVICGVLLLVLFLFFPSQETSKSTEIEKTDGTVAVDLN